MIGPLNFRERQTDRQKESQTDSVSAGCFDQLIPFISELLCEAVYLTVDPYIR